MLPKLLCEELCSLNPMRDRLTFSVIWKVTPEGKVPQVAGSHLLISSPLVASPYSCKQSGKNVIP